MSRRIEIELTSARDDGTWTWRAAGARQPKGVLNGELLYPEAKAGDVVKAEAEFEIDGITITSVLPPREKRQEPERLEITGPQRSSQPLVTSSLVPKRERRRERDGERRPRRDTERRPRSDRAPRARDGKDEAESRGRGDAKPSRQPRADREGRPDRPARGERGAPPERTAPAKPKRLSPRNKHRQAVLEALSPEQRPVAEQVLRGGLPSVRAALEQENTKARAEGRP